MSNYIELYFLFNHIMLHCLPYSDEKFKNQKKLTHISDEEMRSLKNGPFFKWYHRVYQIITFFLFFGPIRLIGMTLSFVLTAIFIFIASSITKYFNCFSDKSRHIIISISRIGLRTFLWSLGVGWIQIEGEFDPDARFLICNHIGFLDPLIMIQIRYVIFVVKKEFTKVKILKNIIDICDPFYVDRSKNCGQTVEIIKRAQDKNRDQIMIFPEGTVSNGKYLLQFHKSAFLSKCKIQPIVMQFWTPLLPKGWNTFSWLSQGTFELLWDQLSIPLSICKIKILDPIYPDSESENADLLATKAQLMMANQLGIQAIDRSSNELFHLK